MCYDIQNPRDISVAQLHEMANVDMLHKRRMKQLLCIIYDIVSKTPRHVVMHLATKRNIDVNRANYPTIFQIPLYGGGTNLE